MRKAFTLLELLVVMGIMGLLGTISVGGYRAMQRGMEERGVMQNVNSFIRSAYQRAQIDRQPTAIYFWNETLRSSSATENEIVVGKAVAIRRYGRFSDFDGGVLVDEFADLNSTYQIQSVEEGEEGGAGARESQMYIYPMEKLSDIASATTLRRSAVEGRVKKVPDSVIFLSGPKSDDTAEEQIPRWGFVLADAGGINWRSGMAYGMEFMTLELPHNYIFGTDYSTSVENPIRGAGTLVFDVGVNRGNGLTTGGTVSRDNISVCSLRQEGASLKAKEVAKSESPERSLD